MNTVAAPKKAVASTGTETEKLIKNYMILKQEFSFVVTKKWLNAIVKMRGDKGDDKARQMGQSPRGHERSKIQKKFC